ncbi:MAG: dihydrofolate reductase family protein [Verrucomicrobia bacterium]|nr:dihydrofolate reductase family protein [Verrucomicrobiota bacterium]
MAMTADGKITTANRAVAAFSSARDRAHLLALRATADAVMAGARTVDLHPINLGPGPKRYRARRLRSNLAEYNLRIVVSGSGSLDPDAEIFRHRFSPILILTTRRVPAAKLRRLRALADEVRVCGDTEIDFRRALRWLHRKWHVRRLVCEGGGELNAALFAARLVRELHLTVCPSVFGGRTAPTIADGLGCQRLADAARLVLKSRRRVGGELFLVYGSGARNPGGSQVHRLSTQRARSQSTSLRRFK